MASAGALRLVAWGRHPLAWCLLLAMCWHLLVRSIGGARVSSLADLMVPAGTPGMAPLRVYLSRAMYFALFPGTLVGMVMVRRLRRSRLAGGGNADLDVLPGQAGRLQRMMLVSLLEATVAIHLAGHVAGASWEYWNGERGLKAIFPWQFGIRAWPEGAPLVGSVLSEVAWHLRVLVLHLVVLQVACMASLLRIPIWGRVAVFVGVSLAWPMLKGLAYTVEDSLRGMGVLAREPAPLVTVMLFDAASSGLIAWCLWLAIRRLILTPVELDQGM